MSSIGPRADGYAAAPGFYEEPPSSDSDSDPDPFDTLGPDFSNGTTGCGFNTIGCITQMRENIVKMFGPSGDNTLSSLTSANVEVNAPVMHNKYQLRYEAVNIADFKKNLNYLIKGGGKKQRRSIKKRRKSMSKRRKNRRRSNKKQRRQ